MHCNQSNEFFGLVRHCCYIFLVGGTRTGIGMLGVRYFGLLIFIIGLFFMPYIYVYVRQMTMTKETALTNCMLTAALVADTTLPPMIMKLTL